MTGTASTDVGRRRWHVLVRALCVGGLAAIAAMMPLIGGGHAAASGDPVIAAAGDISCDPLNGGYNGGNGTATDCREKYTANLLPGVDAVLALGDEQYECGGLSAFQAAYDPTWGQQRPITYPVPGNHEYQTTGGTDCSTNASGYYTYFGPAAGDPTKGYYSFTLGSWHLIALNSECAQIGGCGVGSPEDLWLQNDLAANASAPCTMAYWHRPRFASSPDGGDATFDQFWRDLYAAHADVVLTGHQHWYERFALQSPTKQPDANGIREFIVGTGGESYIQPSATRAANSEVLNWGQQAYGVLKMTLHPGSYDWTFVPDTGTFSDSGSNACHNSQQTGDITPPTTSISCDGTACSSGWYKAPPMTVAMSATDNAGGSGVDATYYTTDGSTPTTSSAVYTGPFALSETATVKYFSTDLAGNAEAIKAQAIRIDAAPPTVTITQPANGASFGQGSKVEITATATDVGTGSGAPSGIASISFYLDGTKLLGTIRSAPYKVTWKGKKARGTHTLTAVATDVAGNTTWSAPVTITIT